MTGTALADVDRLLAQTFAVLNGIVESGGDAELVAVLGRCEAAARRLDRVSVGAVAGLERRGVFDAIATVVDVRARPVTADDHRPAGERQAEAPAEVCGWVLDHGDTGIVPECGGRRPTVNVLVRLDDLQNRARAGCLDFGGATSPEALRMLACDAAVVPIVLNGKGQPLDVGRATRTIPDGLRRAVAARDEGCAHPGCDRPPSWSEVHHIQEWEHGGETKLSNLVMLCRQHHRQIHVTEWIVRIRDGLPEFVPPEWIDHHRTARRKVLSQLVAIGGGPAGENGHSAALRVTLGASGRRPP